MIPGPGFRRNAVEPVGTPPHGDFPQCHQIVLREEILCRQPGLVRVIDLSFPQPVEQFRGLDVHQLDLVRQVEDIIRDPLPDQDPRNGCHLVLQAFQMLDIQRCIDIDPMHQQLLDVPVPLPVARSGCIGVGQFIHQGDLRGTGDHRIGIHLPELQPIVVLHPAGHGFQTLCLPARIRPVMGFQISNDHIRAFLPRGFSRLQHGTGLAGSGRIPEKDFQPAALVTCVSCIRHGLILPQRPCA